MKMDCLPYSNEHLLNNFPPKLRQNFKELLCSDNLGLISLSLNDITSVKHYTENKSTYGYCYTLKIPYAGRRLSWELIFDPEDMSFAPDFNFNDDSFHLSEELEVVIENVPSLVNWNINNPKSLRSVLKEWLTLFKKQQLEKLQDNVYSHLHTEYKNLIEEVPASDVEIYLENTCAHFLINIKVDITSLPEYLQPTKNSTEELLNPGENRCVLKVTYNSMDGSNVSTYLQLSPYLDQVLGSANTLLVPKFFKQTSLVDYVNSIRKLCQKHIKQIEENYKCKKEFITCLCTNHAKSMIEFDSETFSKAQFLCQMEDYHCMVHLELGESYPKQAPTVTLYSIYCLPVKNCSKKVSFQYNSDWSPEEVLSKIKASLIETLPKYKSHSH